MHNLETAWHVTYINACFHLSGKKLGYLHLKNFSQIQMCIVLEATIDTTPMQDDCCSLHLSS